MVGIFTVLSIRMVVMILPPGGCWLITSPLVTPAGRVQTNNITTGSPRREGGGDGGTVMEGGAVDAAGARARVERGP